jgi:transcriptional regulator GlxA family with amidase domain
VQDGKFFTSSGVSAGMDMALAAAADLFGRAAADEMAEGCEYIWNDDPDHDPFAALAGLT